MFGNNVLGIIFAYAHEERVRDLTELRVMASVPFGGRYRLVDFTLSNMVNSGLNKVGIITAAEDIHERGFSGSVFPNDAVDFSALHLQLRIVQRFHTEEFLGDIPHFKYIIRHSALPFA